jgi:hypothetical protein
VKTFVSGSPGINMQHVVFRVENNFQDMGMAANKKLWWFKPKNVSHPGFVVSGITTNVGNQYIHFFAKEPLVNRKHAPDNVIVDVSVNGAQRFKSRKLVGSFGIANIAGVPDFVNRFKKFKNAIA